MVLDTERTTSIECWESVSNLQPPGHHLHLRDVLDRERDEDGERHLHGLELAESDEHQGAGHGRVRQEREGGEGQHHGQADGHEKRDKEDTLHAPGHPEMNSFLSENGCNTKQKKKWLTVELTQYLMSFKGTAVDAFVCM
ncbi:multidrug resistance-associated protein 4 [Biomphalaria glabrata]